MALTRFAGGGPGTFKLSILNILTQLAYPVVVTIAGARAFHASISTRLHLLFHSALMYYLFVNSNILFIIKITIISMNVMFLSICGLDFVKLWRRWAWMICTSDELIYLASLLDDSRPRCFIIFLIIIVLSARGGCGVNKATPHRTLGLIWLRKCITVKALPRHWYHEALRQFLGIHFTVIYFNSEGIGAKS